MDSTLGFPKFRTHDHKTVRNINLIKDLLTCIEIVGAEYQQEQYCKTNALVFTGMGHRTYT